MPSTSHKLRRGKAFELESVRSSKIVDLRWGVTSVPELFGGYWPFDYCGWLAWAIWSGLNIAAQFGLFGAVVTEMRIGPPERGVRVSSLLPLRFLVARLPLVWLRLVWWMPLGLKIKVSWNVKGSEIERAVICKKKAKFLLGQSR